MNNIEICVELRKTNHRIINEFKNISIFHHVVLINEELEFDITFTDSIIIYGQLFC